MQIHGQTDTLTGKSNKNIEGKGKKRQNSETYNGDLINEYAKQQIKKTIEAREERSPNEIVKLKQNEEENEYNQSELDK